MTKILAIDDRLDNLVTIEAVLKSYLQGCSVVTALSGKDGLEKARKEYPDVIVLDVYMPEMDGYEVCAELKKNPDTAYIPVLLLTAVHTDTESRIQGLETGADAFLTKPIDESELIAQIKVLLRIKYSEDTLRRERDNLEQVVRQRTSELEASRESLLKERDFIQSLSDTSPACFVACNEAGKIIETGRAFRVMLDTDDASVKGKNFFVDIITDSYRKIAKKQSSEAVKKKTTVFFEAGISFNGKTEHLVEWYGRPRFRKDGSLEFMFFVGIDITERRRLETMLVKTGEQERMRIGRDLHDGLGQHLAGMLFKSEALKIALQNYGQKEARDAEEIYAMVSVAINQTRDLARGLCPVEAAGGGLSAALTELAGEINASEESSVVFKKETELDFEDPAGASQLYYIAREAVVNAVKHGKASTIIISLARRDESWVLTINDNGVGLSSEAGNEGAGLGIMRYRAWMIGGGLSISPAPGGGTSVVCELRPENAALKTIARNNDNPEYKASGSEALRVLIIDDHPIVRQGLSGIIEKEDDITVCGEARSAEEALQLIDRLKPDLVTVDISLKGTSGIDLVKALKSRFPGLPALVISIYDESLYAERAIAVGARGYVMKQQPAEVIIKAIRTVLAGKQFFSEKIKDRFMDRFQYDVNTGGKVSLEALTNREYEVFQFIGQGMGNRAIAEKLNIGLKTVENYRERIKYKLNMETSSDLVQFSVQWTLNHSRE